MRMNLLAVAAVPALLSAASYGAIAQYNVQGILNDAPSNVGGSIGFSAFDSALGTLLSVTWQATVTASDGTIIVFNSFDTPKTYSVAITNTIVLNGQLVQLTQNANNIAVPANSNSSADLTDDSDSFAGSDANLNGYINTVIGSNTVFYAYMSSVGYTATSEGEGAIQIPAATITDPLDFVLTVTYTYETVPEAASLSILSVAALGLLARRRKQ